MADGVIVGSAIVKLVEKYGEQDACRTSRAFVRSLRGRWTLATGRRWPPH